jgi:hypothetical protein
MTAIRSLPACAFMMWSRIMSPVLLPPCLLTWLGQIGATRWFLDNHPAGKIGTEQVRVLEVEPGEHRLCMRFVGPRRSGELRTFLR